MYMSNYLCRAIQAGKKFVHDYGDPEHLYDKRM